MKNPKYKWVCKTESHLVLWKKERVHLGGPPLSSATGLKDCTTKGPSSPQEEAFYLYHADASCKVAINSTFDCIFITGTLQATSLPPLLCLRARAAAVQQTTFTFAFIKPCPFRGKRGELYIQGKINEISTLCK